jgi:hypothetical protein
VKSVFLEADLLKSQPSRTVVSQTAEGINQFHKFSTFKGLWNQYLITWMEENTTELYTLRRYKV